MNRVVPSASPHAKGFVYETPNGTKRFVAHVLFDDAAMSNVRGDFDHREEVKVSFPIQGSSLWRVRGAKWGGTDARHLDAHTYAATIGRNRGVDLASLMEFGFARSATIRGGPLTETVELQHHGKNARVLDVGKVDERGIAWTSPVYANRISGDRSQRTQIQDGAVLPFYASSFGVPSNLRFEIDVFAPALTPRGNVVLTPEEQKKIIKKLGISVETDFLPRGFRHKLLSYQANVGPDGNDMRLGWELADPANFKNQGQPPAGDYPVRIMKGKEVLASFTLAWQP
jgi:hypothetical protein